MTDIREGIACLYVGGNQTGTAWLMTRSLLCTANHCVASLADGAEVKLNFNGTLVAGVVYRRNVALDIALIRVEPDSHEGSPLTLIDRPTTAPHRHRQSWSAIGFPDSVLGYDAKQVSQSIAGTIAEFRGEKLKSPRMELTCEQGGKLNPEEGSSLKGVSGGPVAVRVNDDDQFECVVAFISENTVGSDRTIYATPIDAVLHAFPEIIEQAAIRSWDAARQIPFIVADNDGTFRTNIDRTLLDSIWSQGKGMRGFRTNIQAGDCTWLASAIERIIVHSPFEGSRPSTDLHVTGEAAWQSRCRKCARDWLPIEGQHEQTPISKYRFIEKGSENLPLGGRRFFDRDSLARFLQELCNQWVLDQLCDKMVEVFSDESIVGFRFASDIASQMEILWSKWVADFKDADLLHHFLGLVLTGNGNQSMQRTAAGVGPETLETCLLRATAFTLAVCTALPPAIHALKPDVPGNIGDSDMSGHSCGMQARGGKKLNVEMYDRSHRWQTAFVMLPHFSDLWETEAARQARFDRQVNVKGASLTAEPSESVVISGASDLLVAIETGHKELCSAIAALCDSSAKTERSFVEEGSNVGYKPR